MSKRKDKRNRILYKKIPWGLIYLLLIPLYALVYYLMPDDYFIYSHLGSTFLSCLYFSAVTITTLGFGDIAPTNNIASTALASECVIGVIVIGLFLNSLSFSQSLRLSEEEEEKDLVKSYRYERNRTIQYNRVVLVSIKHYSHAVLTMLDYNKEVFDNMRDGLRLNDITGIFRNAVTKDNVCLPYSNIYYFYKYHRYFVRCIEELIREIDMAYWPEFDKLCADFVLNSSMLFDYREYFLETVPGSDEAEKVTEALAAFKENEEDETNAEEIDFRPFVHLRNLLVYEARFIERYKDWINLLETAPPDLLCNPREVAGKRK